MDILPAGPKFNRARYRAAGAEVRRMSKGIAGDRGAPLIPILDEGPRVDPTRKYSPFLNVMGRIVGDENMVRAARGSSSALTNRVNNLAHLAAQAVSHLPGTLEERIAAVTCPAAAGKVARAARDLQSRGLPAEDALAGAFALLFLEGMAAVSGGQVSPAREGYENALGFAMRAVERKQMGLGGLGAPVPGVRPVPVSLTVNADLTKLPEVPYGLVMRAPVLQKGQLAAGGLDFFNPAGIAPYRFIQLANGLKGKSPSELAAIVGGPSRDPVTRYIAWVVLNSPVFQRDGFSAFEDGKFYDSITKYAGQTKFLDAKSTQELADVLRGRGPIFADIANDPEDAAAWSFRAASTLYYRLLTEMGVDVCAPDIKVRTDSEWIVTTACGIDTQQCRDDKIKAVTNALRRVLGREPTACDINMCYS
jgi:hypothetical protein